MAADQPISIVLLQRFYFIHINEDITKEYSPQKRQLSVEINCLENIASSRVPRLIRLFVEHSCTVLGIFSVNVKGECRERDHKHICTRLWFGLDFLHHIRKHICEARRSQIIPPRKINGSSIHKSQSNLLLQATSLVDTLDQILRSFDNYLVSVVPCASPVSL